MKAALARGSRRIFAADRLAALEQGLAGEIRPGVRILRTARGEIDPAILLGLDAGAEDGIDDRPSHHDGEEEHDHDDFESLIVDQIGRASCRERVCQYVLIQVVAVTLKKKTNIIN